jgi:hypothetical protein
MVVPFVRLMYTLQEITVLFVYNSYPREMRQTSTSIPEVEFEPKEPNLQFLWASSQMMKDSFHFYGLFLVYDTTWSSGILAVINTMTTTIKIQKCNDLYWIRNRNYKVASS